MWPSPITPEWSIADPDVLGTEFHSISASKRRTNAVKQITPRKLRTIDENYPQKIVFFIYFYSNFVDAEFVDMDYII